MSDATTDPEMTDAADETEGATATAEAETEEGLNLKVEIEEVGPCRKSVSVTVPESDIDRFRNTTIDQLRGEAQVPGFRVGKVPKALLLKRFKEELGNELKQQVLLQSLQQVTEEHNLDPIDEPDIDVESLEIPDEGDFQFDFEVEVTPEFSLPDYSGFTIDKPTRDVTDEDVDSYIARVLEQYGELQEKEGKLNADDFAVLSATFKHGDKLLHKADEFTARLKPTLRFADAELTGFDDLLAGKSVGDSVTAEVVISSEAEQIEMRGETVSVEFHVKKVMELSTPKMDKEFLERIDMETEEDLRIEVRSTLTRQVEYRQRQTTREQVLEKITESADWDLPEEYVLKHVENAMRREVLEMQQAGFSQQEIQAHENELRQRAVSTTRQNLKEHFVLNKIATEENIEASPQEVQTEIAMMAMQRGENPRRVAARLQKSGMVENLEAQIRERNAVDFVLSKASFNETEMEPLVQTSDVEAVRVSVLGLGGVSGSDIEEEDTTSEEE